MESKLRLREMLSKEQSEGKVRANSKSSIENYIRQNVEQFASSELDEQEKNRICKQLEVYVKDYIKDEANRLTFNSLCIKRNKVGKIKVKKNAIEVCYAVGFVLMMVWCLVG